jgi:hypothetical protein
LQGPFRSARLIATEQGRRCGPEVHIRPDGLPARLSIVIQCVVAADSGQFEQITTSVVMRKLDRRLFDAFS